MILITGATGTIGRALVPELLARGARVRAMTRDTSRATTLFPANIELVRGDFTDVASLPSALEGVETVFLLTPPGPSAAAHDLAMMTAIKRARVSHVVKMSAFGAGDSPPVKAAAWHGPGERAVIDSGLRWTILRPAAFASNALQWAHAMRASAPVEIATGSGKHAVVDPRDVAAVAARALTSSEHDGQAYTLTGPMPLTAHEQIAILGDILRRPIDARDVSLDVTAASARSVGLPDAFIEAMVEGLAFVRDGKAAEQTDTVERVLGRPPHPFADWVRDHTTAFA